MMEVKYKRLTRARARSAFAVAFMSRSSLWLGEDHLLCVDSNGYAENYKRFYFRDIQAVIIRKTNRRRIWNLVWGSLFSMCAVVLIDGLFDIQNRSTHSDDVWGFVGWGLPAAFFLSFLFINSLLGPAVTCQLRTAVQIENLPSLCRVRQTRKILDKLRPLITAAQGQISAEEISERMRETIQPVLPQSEAAPPVIS
jgi:hypothetical protein